MRSYSDWVNTADSKNISWLNDFVAERRAQFNALGFPTQKTEHFRFNDLACLNTIDWTNKATDISDKAVANKIDEMASSCPFEQVNRLVFIDGQLNEAHSDCQTYTRFKNADSAAQSRILDGLNQSDFTRNAFASAICANIGDGVYVNASALSAPLDILHIQTKQSATSTALVFVLGANDDAIVLERFVNLTSANVLHQTHTVCEIGDNAKFTHYRLNDEDNVHLGQVDYMLSRDSRLDAFHLGFGTTLKRMDLNIRHRDSGSHAQLNGIYIGQDNQQIDYHNTIEHTVAHCESDEVFRGILNDQAVGVFNGRIHIHPDAQKTRAELSNKNLLLNAGARIQTKPELEIYADDVICAHGATVSRLDGDELFYLLARGIDKPQAELMLTFAFINALLEDISHNEIAEYCRPLLAERLNSTP